MVDDLNLIKNPDFSQGKQRPNAWQWRAAGDSVRWSRPLEEAVEFVAPADAVASANTRGVVLESSDSTGMGEWSQRINCKPGNYYRLDARATCNLMADDPLDGLVIKVQPISDGKPMGKYLLAPGLQQSASPVDIRVHYEVPEDVRCLEISVGIARARGCVCVYKVRCLFMLEPEEESHSLSIPPPDYAQQPPVKVSKVWVCSDQSPDRPIIGLLKRCLGENHVRTVPPQDFKVAGAIPSALLLPDATPPRAIRSLSALLKLAEHRIVVISLPSFQKLTKGKLTVKPVIQVDDPPCAKVTYASYATRGFALADVFEFHWPGKQDGSFVHNQFRPDAEFKVFCKRHGFVTLLESACCRDATTDNPLCIHRLTPDGGLFVLDIEPAEAPGSMRDEPTLAIHLLLTILGQVQPGLGQYVVPERSESDFRTAIREMEQRFDPIVVHDNDVPVAEVTQQLVTIGGTDQDYGLPLRPKPVVLVRSGLISGDVESVYGSLFWFKQFVRPTPFSCSYAKDLAARFRFAWIPLTAQWDVHDAFRRHRWSPDNEVSLDLQTGGVAALIDVVSHPVQKAQLMVPASADPYAHYADWLPRLFDAFPPGRYFSPSVNEGDDLADRNHLQWSWTNPSVEVLVDGKVFQDGIHQEVMRTGGRVIRLQVPGHEAGFVSHSIHRTDLIATLLEQIIGLQFGLIAVNRRRAPVSFDAKPPVKPGEALVIPAGDPLLARTVSQAG